MTRRDCLLLLATIEELAADVTFSSTNRVDMMRRLAGVGVTSLRLELVPLPDDDAVFEGIDLAARALIGDLERAAPDERHVLWEAAQTLRDRYGVEAT